MSCWREGVAANETIRMWAEALSFPGGNALCDPIGLHSPF